MWRMIDPGNINNIVNVTKDVKLSLNYIHVTVVPVTGLNKEFTSMNLNLTMIKSGCSHTGSLCLVVFLQDKQADFHGSKGSSSTVRGLDAGPLVQLNSTQSLQTTP